MQVQLEPCRNKSVQSSWSQWSITNHQSLSLSEFAGVMPTPFLSLELAVNTLLHIIVYPVICKHFSVHVKKPCFLILHGMVLTHALWNKTFLYS